MLSFNANHLSLNLKVIAANEHKPRHLIEVPLTMLTHKKSGKMSKHHLIVVNHIINCLLLLPRLVETKC
ncbi:hypothetical protein MNBD_GAMMA02-167 [hydrothermal vent metagenome]|uniref:Uncharacterized protein n=1 Tax=hydrothermal vent metagenome TaxID=652676 RepID=A0A3B0W3Z8_9ZZZZ